MRTIKYNILLKATETPDNGYSQGDTVNLYNDIFCKENGVAFWNINPKAWDIVYVRQFTGLLDKNGKEIYEGDIVKSMSDVAPVVYQDGCFMWWGEPLGLSITGNYDAGVEIETADTAEWAEVVGKIHES